MSHSVPNWNVEDEPASFQDLISSDTENNTVGPQHELMELLWKDGHLVMQSQIQPKLPSIAKDPKQVQKPESAPEFAVPLTDPDGLIQEDETPSWFQYPLDDALEKDFSEFFSGLPTSDAISADDKIDLMPPPKTHVACSHQLHAEPVKADSCDVSSDRREDLHPKSVVDGSNDRLQHEKIQTEGHEGGITSSSCISGTSLGREVQYCDRNKGHKRKSGEGEDSKLQREETEYETLNTNKATQRSTNARRSRAAEVHNLSERKRRDRINKKMKQLQELVPNCNKSDKASMLDEVIEYVKSLQIQVQLMWMGCRMFSGFQHYMTQMGIGTSYSSMFPAHNPSQLPVLPLLNPSTPAAFGPLSFPNQMRNLHTSAQCVHNLGFQPMQPPPQAIHAYPFSSRIAHRN